MKRLLRASRAWLLLPACICGFAAASQERNPLRDSRDFYGICWNGDAHGNLLFARQMGYDYVMYQRDMEKDELAADLGFYIESPQYAVYPVPRTLNLAKSYTATEKALYEKYFAKKDNQPFPNNLATGWFVSDNAFSVEPDYQRQEVIDDFIGWMITYAATLERKDKKFLFAGFAWDVPNLPGDFWDKPQKKGGRQSTLALWTGKDSAYQLEGARTQYATMSDGHAAFNAQLFRKTRERFPQAKFIIEPYRVWEDWIKQVKDRPDVKEMMPDLVLQESAGTQFVTDERIHSSGLIKGKDSVGSTTPNIFGEQPNREVAAQAALNGSWFGWFGRFGGTGDMPGYKKIQDVPARLQLVRRVPAWDNQNRIPLKDRHWDGSVYSSPTSQISEHLIWSVHPKTGKLFAVWLSEAGVLKLPVGLKFKTIQRTDGFFIETEEAMADFIVMGSGIKPAHGNGLGKGYVITVEN